jgi:hypothetical protein
VTSKLKATLRRTTFKTFSGFFANIIASLGTYLGATHALTEFVSTDWVLGIAARFVYLPIYVGLWIFGLYSAVKAWKGLYGSVPTSRKSKILGYVIASVFAFILGFATVYFDLSYKHEHFETAGPLSPMSALYFSVVTFATVGYGDIVPKSDIARFWVMVEIIGGLAYTILIFSVIAGFIRQPPAKTSPGDSNVAP